MNFVEPWPGGWWRLRDIIEYELVCARSILTLAARYRDQFQSQYRTMARDAIEAGRTEPPYGWVVPADQLDPGRAADMVRILHETGIDVHRAGEPFEVAGRTFPSGSWILPAAQPFRPHLKDMMERQVYPNRLSASGEPEPPYDVAGWTLPLQMGVESVELLEPFDPTGQPLARIDSPDGTITGAENPDVYILDNQTDDDFLVLNDLLDAGIEVLVLTEQPAVLREQDDETPTRIPIGRMLVRGTPEVRRVIEKALKGRACHVQGVSGRLEFPEDQSDSSIRVYGNPGDPSLNSRLNRESKGAYDAARASKQVRVVERPLIGLYQPWVPSMDEGWTRLVLENFDFPYTTLHNAQVRAEGLHERFDAIVLPSVGTRTLREGYEPNETEPQYVGGLGKEGSEALRAFVRQGGTLVCLEQSSLYAIAEWGLPVKEVLGRLNRTEFYGPGSVVNVEYPEAPHPLTFGMPHQGHAYFNHSLAFENTDGGGIDIIMRYAPHDVLASGWLLGDEKLEGKAAAVSIPLEDGRIILFGVPVQHRGQTRATFRLLFNALLSSSHERVD